jgi:hypothetical protein
MTREVDGNAVKGVAFVLLHDLAVGKGTLAQTFDPIEKTCIFEAPSAEVVVVACLTLGHGTETVVAVGHAFRVLSDELSHGSDEAHRNVVGCTLKCFGALSHSIIITLSSGLVLTYLVKFSEIPRSNFSCSKARS